MYQTQDILIDASSHEMGYTVINIGPQHPSTHGVLNLVVTLDGEKIIKIEPHLGFIHRSIEKMCESLSYRQFIYATSRMDYLSAHINNHACALCVEKGLQVEIPVRAQVIRFLMDELTRVASHLLWWGAQAMDLGAFTPYFYAFRERELITSIMEESCGARLTMNYMVPGGVMYDVHANFQQKVKQFIQQYKEKRPEYDDLVTHNVIFKSRMQGIGIITPADAINFGCTGPVARGSGVSCDVRLINKYEHYKNFTIHEIIENGGDCYARYLVRLKEMDESVKMIEEWIDNIPEGEFQAKTKTVLKLPKGDFFQSVETARGEFGVYIVSDGGSTPYRIKFRSPGFSNLSILNHISQGAKIGDLIAILGTLDLVIPDIDR